MKEIEDLLKGICSDVEWGVSASARIPTAIQDLRKLVYKKVYPIVGETYAIRICNEIFGSPYEVINKIGEEHYEKRTVKKEK